MVDRNLVQNPHAAHGYRRNCLSRSLAAVSSILHFIGIGGGLSANRMFIINLAKPGFDTIAMAD
jgi:hypothetical protein